MKKILFSLAMMVGFTVAANAQASGLQGIGNAGFLYSMINPTSSASTAAATVPGLTANPSTFYPGFIG